MSSQPPRRVIPIKVERAAAPAGAHRDIVVDICTRLKDVPGALLPIFHAVQAAVGYVPHDSVPLIAHELNLSVAEVHGVLSFYHYFRKAPVGRHVVHLCRAEACQSVGAVALEAHAKRRLGIGFHATTPDGAITLEPVYCLGNCALGPSLMIDATGHAQGASPARSTLQGRVTAHRFDELMAGLQTPAAATP